jgi:hypothetical protein
VVRSVVYKVLGDRLDIEEARTLALSGDLEAVLQRLEKRRLVQRHYLTDEEQRQLAVQEVSLELAGVAEREIAALGTETVRRARNARQEARAINEAVRRADQRFRRLEIEAPVLRRFLRKAKRLRQRQLRSLELAIRDLEALRDAKDELDAVYASFLDEATSLTS